MTRGDDHHCATCADAADRAIIRAIRGGDADVTLADGTTRTVAIELVPGAAAGDAVLVHQGVAISRIQPEGCQP